MMTKEYEVEAVKGRRIKHGAVQYLLKWKGYDEETWTLDSECGSCKELVAEFEKNHPLTQASPTPAPSSGARGRSSTRLQSKITDQTSANSTPTTGRSAHNERRASAADGPKSSSDDSDEEEVEKSETSKQARRTSGRICAGGKATVKHSAYRRRNSPGKGANDSEDGAKTGETTAEAKKRKVDARRPGDVVKSNNAKCSSEDSEEEEVEKPGMDKTTRRTSARMSMGGKVSVKQSVKRGRKSNGMGADDPEDGAKTAQTTAAAKKRKVDARRESDVVMSKNAKSSSEDSEEEEVEKPGMDKQSKRTSARVSMDGKMTKKPPATNGRLSASTRANVAVKKASMFAPDDVDENSTAWAQTERRITRRSQTAGNVVVPSVKRQRTDPDAKLEEALTALLIVDPYARFITPGTDPNGDDAISIPAKIMKPEELPRITVWVEKSYTDKGHTITAPKGNIEKFGDREVIGIIGYVAAPTRPFVLVKLSKKKDEVSMRVKDCVQAVHCPLAERLFPKTYKSYMDRVAQLPSASSNVAGPSGHSTPR